MTTSMEFVASAEITAADGIRSSVAGAAAAFTVAHYRLINTTPQTPSREISRAKWYLLLAARHRARRRFVGFSRVTCTQNAQSQSIFIIFFYKASLHWVLMQNQESAVLQSSISCRWWFLVRIKDAFVTNDITISFVLNVHLLADVCTVWLVQVYTLWRAPYGHRVRVTRLYTACTIQYPTKPVLATNWFVNIYCYTILT